MRMRRRTAKKASSLFVFISAVVSCSIFVIVLMTMVSYIDDDSSSVGTGIRDSFRWYDEDDLSFCGRKVDYKDAASSIEAENDLFVFIGGPHFSGTSLLNVLFENDESGMFSVIEDSCAPENEGTKLQNVFSQPRSWGGPCTYALKREILQQSVRVDRANLRNSPGEKRIFENGVCGAYINDESTKGDASPMFCHSRSHVRRFPLDERMGGPRKQRLVESDVRPHDTRLKNQWDLWWGKTRDVARRQIYVEKSPNHVVNSRWMQRVFAVYGKSLFIFTLRHPLSIYENHCNDKVSIALYLENWLSQVETLREDIRHLKQAVVLRYEDWVQDEHIAITIFEKLKQRIFRMGDIQDVWKKHGQRKLMYYHGDRSAPKIIPSVIRFEPVKDDRILRAYEDRLSVFGYSLKMPFVRRPDEEATHPHAFSQWPV